MGGDESLSLSLANCNFINDVKKLMVAVFGEQYYSRNA